MDLDSMVAPYGYYAIKNGKERGGCALLIRQCMKACIRKVLTSGSDGRLCGVVLEQAGQRLVVVTAYMPTGLDFVSDSAAKALVPSPDKLYRQVLKWTSVDVCDRAMMLGDLNETMTAMDRSSTAGKHGRWISCLPSAGFVDAYRAVHGTNKSGYTHCAKRGDGVPAAQSRLDYVFVRGWDTEGIRECQVVQSMQVSNHRLVWTEMDSAMQMQVHAQPVPLRLPNLRNASEAQKAKLVQSLHSTCLSCHDELMALSHGDRASVDKLAEKLSSLAYQAARRCLNQTGGKPMQSKQLLVLSRRRSYLSSCRAVVRAILADPAKLGLGHDKQWRKLNAKCQVVLGHAWQYDPVVQLAAWQAEVSLLLTSVRRQLRQESQLVRRQSKDRWQASSEAAVHRMLRSSKSAALASVIDPVTNELQVQPEDVKRVLHDHFADVFALQPVSESKSEADPLSQLDPAWLDRVYGTKPDINPAWYASLMAPCTEAELMSLVSSVGAVVAPGTDKVSAGVWKLAIQGSSTVCQIVLAMLNACLRLRMMPQLGKQSIIVPVLKKVQEEPSVSNVRPISLQTAITKLLSKLLADRLCIILSRHPILHPAQEGFIRNGSVFRCIDMCLDVWEVAKQRRKACYNIFYDVKAAYDSVQHVDLIRSLHRLVMPVEFMELVADSLCGLTSTIRTPYGESESFPVQKSVRQGDPLAPLLYVCFMDPLHCGLENNPLHDGCRDGFELGRGMIVSGKGYADDTWAVSGSVSGLQRMNEWVTAFCAVNHLCMNGRKTELIGRNVDGSCMINNSIHVGDVLVQPTPLDQSIRYLGVFMNMQLQWTEQSAVVTQAVQSFCGLAIKHRLSVPRAVHLFNVYLIPRIEFGLRYINVTGWLTQFEQWDKSLVRAIGQLCKMPRRLNRGAVTTLTGLILPSTHAQVVRISEAFIRCNSESVSESALPVASDSVASDESRSTPSWWVNSGRQRWQHGVSTGTSASSSSSSSRFSATNRLVQVNAMARDTLGWCMRPVQRPRHMLNDVLHGAPSGAAYVAKSIQLAGHSYPIVFGYECGHGWGTRYGHANIRVCTDGSASASAPHVGNGDGDAHHGHSSSSSAWAVCYVEDEFEQCYTSLPGEPHLSMSHLRYMSVWGAGISLTVSHGIYMAEMQAVLRAIASVPVGWTVQVVMDSKSVLHAIQSYVNASSVRQQLRMEGRPMLALIGKQIKWKQQHGGDVQFVHTRSHTSDDSVNAVGNRCADVVAGAERQTMIRAGVGHDVAGLAVPAPGGMSSVDVSQGETWLSITYHQQLQQHHMSADGSVRRGAAGAVVPITGDVRRAARAGMSARAHVMWKHSGSQARFSSSLALVDQYRWLVQDAPPMLSRCVPFFLRLATDTMHVWWDATDEKQHVKQHECAACDDGSVRDVVHMLSCAHESESRRRVVQQLLDVVQSVAGDVPSAMAWRASIDVSMPEMLSIMLMQVCKVGVSVGTGADAGSSGIGDMVRGSGGSELESNRARLLFGGFSMAEGRCAMSKLGLRAGMVNAHGEEYRVKVMSGWRAVLFSYAHELWRSGLPQQVPVGGRAS